MGEGAGIEPEVLLLREERKSHTGKAAYLPPRRDPINPADNYFLPSKRSARIRAPRHALRVRSGMRCAAGLSTNEDRAGNPLIAATRERTMDAIPGVRRGIQCTSGARCTPSTDASSRFNLYRCITPSHTCAAHLHRVLDREKRCSIDAGRL